MRQDLEGRVAIVTGASSGLGRAAASALLADGAFVVAAARSEDRLQELAAAHPKRVVSCLCDMRDPEQVVRLPRAAVDAFGRLDIVVNNAGIAPAGPFSEQAQELWDEVFMVNVTAPAVLTRAAAPLLLKQRSGKIINIASLSGLLGKAQLVAYSSSKGALVQFTKALAVEWAPFNVQVNAIAPGAFETAAQKAVLESPETLARRLRKIPARRMGQPSEIGPLITLLASSASDFITGSIFVIDGGESCKL